jgi:hypothetical protein
MSDDYIASEAIGRRACLTCERCRLCCGCSCAMRGPVVPEHFPRVVKIENSVTDNTCMFNVSLIIPGACREERAYHFQHFHLSGSTDAGLMNHASCIGMPYIVGLAFQGLTDCSIG